MTHPRKIILRNSQHELVAAFECNLIDFMNVQPDVIFWSNKAWSFTTMGVESTTYSESFAFALQEGVTARRMTSGELDGIPLVEPASDASTVNVAIPGAIPETYPYHDSR